MKHRDLSAPRSEFYDRTWLQKARLVLNLTQSDVADACGISTGHYNRIEAGVCVPTIKVGLKIADVLHVDARNFLDERKIA